MQKKMIKTAAIESLGLDKERQNKLNNLGFDNISSIGDLAILNFKKTAFFCSSKCPGGKIIKTFDYVKEERDKGTVIISGFHSPIEMESLGILIRGKQPIIICPARGLESMRIPKEWRKLIDEDRLLLLSPFEAKHKRLSEERCWKRNLFVAAIADEIMIAHAEPGSKTEELVRVIEGWGEQVYKL